MSAFWLAFMAMHTMYSCSYAQQTIVTELYGSKWGEYEEVKAFNQGRINNIFSWKVRLCGLAYGWHVVDIGWNADHKTYSGGNIASDTGSCDYKVCTPFELSPGEYIDGYRVQTGWGTNKQYVFGISFSTTNNKYYQCGPEATNLEDSFWIYHLGYYLSGLQWVHQDNQDLNAIAFQFTRVTQQPTSRPTSRPTVRPTPNPTPQPTPQPTPSPTSGPTLGPTLSPTSIPTSSPTTEPTVSPTQCVDLWSDDDSNDGAGNFIVDDYKQYVNITMIKIEYHFEDSEIIDCSITDCRGKEMYLKNEKNNINGSYFVFCTETSQCTDLSLIVDTNKSLILSCNNDYACHGVNVNSFDSDVIIICNASSTCYDGSIDLTHVSMFELHCLSDKSCRNMRVAIRNANIKMNSKIICYVPNACDGINIVTDNPSTQIVLFEYSESVAVNYRFGYNASLPNIQCYNDEEIRWIKYDTNKIRTDEELAKISRESYKLNALPCEDVLVTCGDFECEMRYHFNISADKILESENECVWFEFHRTVEPFCDGLCSNFTYYIHKINIDIKIDFSETTNRTSLCNNFFGNDNSTQNSLDTVDAIINAALRIYFRTSYEWNRYVSILPNTTFITSSWNNFKCHLLCNDTIPSTQVAHLLVTFEIRDIDNNVHKIKSRYENPSEFYNHSYSLLSKYFGDANVIITIDVIHNSIQNIIPMTWYEQVVYEMTSILYSMLWALFYICMGVVGYFHEKYCKTRHFCCNKHVVFYPVDQVKYSYIISYCSKVVANFAAMYFIYKLIVILATKQFNYIILTLNILIVIILIVCVVRSYYLNISIVAKQGLPMNKFYNEWMYSRSRSRSAVWTTLFLSGSVQKAHLFVSSRLLGLPCFICPLNMTDYRTLYHTERKYVLPRTLMEFVFQTISAMTIGASTEIISTFTWAAIVSIVLSIGSLIEAYLEYKWQQSHNYATTPFEIWFKINNHTDNYHINIENKKYYFGYINNRILPDVYGHDHGSEIYHVRILFGKNILTYYGVKKTQCNQDQAPRIDIGIFERDIQRKRLRNAFEGLFEFNFDQNHPERHLLTLLSDNEEKTDEKQEEEQTLTTIDRLWGKTMSSTTSLRKVSDNTTQYGSAENLSWNIAVLSLASTVGDHDHDVLWNTSMEDLEHSNRCGICRIISDCFCQKQESERLLFTEENQGTNWYDKSISSQVYSDDM